MATAPHSSRSKSEHAKKIEFIKDVNQLKLKEQNCEREKKTHLYSKHSDFYKDFCELEEIDLKNNNDLKSEKIRLSTKLQKIKNMVIRFQRELTDVKPTPEFIEKLKGVMEDIESNVSHFKEQQKEHYEVLIKDERMTTQELNALEKRIESWSQVPAINLPSRPVSSRVSSHRDITKDLPPQVATFERFSEQNGGPRGGWDQYDHGTFMKFRNRSKGKLSFLRDLIPALPTKTPVEIRNHEKWYQEFQRLNDLKKEAIQLWKEKKEVEKDEILSSARKQDDVKEDKEMQKLKLQQEIYEQERMHRKAGLNAWKIEKELQRAEEEEKRLRNELEKNKLEEQRRIKQQQLHVYVQEHKQQVEFEKTRQDEERMVQEQMVAYIKQKQAAENISRFQERDDARLHEKIAEQQTKLQAKKERERRLEQMKDKVIVSVERDPSRLYQLTEGWKERKKDTTKTSAGQIYHMPHRAVPSWRKN